MQRLILSLAFVFAGTANADGDDVCVRNFLGGDPAVDVCGSIGGRYIYVQAKDSTTDGTLCALAYPDLACSADQQGYRFVRTKDGGKVCVVDFNQPGVGNYCETAPDLYSYAEPL